MENLEKLILELCKLDNEQPWLEFKHNNYDPDMIGADISALANSAAYYEKNCAYMLWGIDDSTHEIVGTEFNMQTLKKGEQEIESWLRNLLTKNADFSFHTVPINGVNVGILIIARASSQVVSFKKVDYIRIGSYTKPLKEYPTMQAQLWDRLRNTQFEEGFAKDDLELNVALQLLDCSAYFNMCGLGYPTDMEGVAHYMLEEKFIVKQDNGLYSITNLGAILFAKKLSSFSRLARKAVRIVQYQDNSRLVMLKEEVPDTGYAVGFEYIIKYISAIIPTSQPITSALREQKMAYPILAIREAVANALIHQDFSITGTSPTVEIFKSRIEITNAGAPLVDIRRIIDNPPKSRNEKIAALMRRLKICEELGSGWDKIVITCEQAQLPAPKIEEYQDYTKVTLYSEMAYSSISSEDKIRACYMHACVKQVQGEQLTNTSLRERFGLKETASGTVSRLIKEAITLNLIKPLDPTTAPRYMRYIPWWA